MIQLINKYLLKTVNQSKNIKVGKVAFHKFFRAYIDSYASKTVSSHAFRLFFEDYFNGNSKASGVDWEAWCDFPYKQRIRDKLREQKIIGLRSNLLFSVAFLHLPLIIFAMSSLRCFVVSSRLVAPGMLPVEPVYDLSLLDDVKALAADVRGALFARLK